VHAQTTVRIDAPPERVWSVMSDVERWPEWTASITSVRLLDAVALSPGVRVRVRQPRLPPTTWTVTELEEGRSFSWAAAAPGMRTLARHRVDPAGPAGTGSIATLGVDQEGPLGRLLGRVMARLTHRYLATEAAGLRARAEATAP
jgi:uncharacterized membrane protein